MKKPKSKREKYSSSGFSANADTTWVEEGCYYGSEFYFSAESDVNKYQANGKPNTTKATLANAYLEKWSDCSLDGATHTTAYLTIWGGKDNNLGVSKKLDSATYHAEAPMFTYTEECDRICNETEGWCYYGNCESVSDGEVPATIDIAWTASGTVSSFVETGKYKGAGYSISRSSQGKGRPATYAASWILDGTEAIPDGALETADGFIQQVSSKETNVYVV